MITRTTDKGASMNPRNTLNGNPMLKFDVAHNQETYILVANPNTQQIIASPPVMNGFDLQHLAEPQYAAQQVHPGFPIPSPSNFCYGMNNTTLFTEGGFGVGVSSKTCSSAMGNAQYMYASATSSLIMNPVLLDVGFPVMGSGFPMLMYRGQSFVPPGPEYRVNNVTRHPQEIGICGGQRYNDGASTSQGILYHTPVSHPVHGFRPQNIHGGSRSNVSHLPSSTTTLSSNLNNNNTTNQQYPNVSHHRQAPEPAAGPHSRIRVFRRAQTSGHTLQSHNSWRPDLPSLHLLPEEGLAILEFSGDYEVSNHSSIDHHSDMRLDIDYMSYEELLALSEQIGNVKTGLSEEAITTHLKTRAHKLEEKNESCVICQDVYEDKDKIGSLECGHEYHVQCLKKWLPMKNMCPICKSTALLVDPKSG